MRMRARCAAVAMACVLVLLVNDSGSTARADDAASTVSVDASDPEDVPLAVDDPYELDSDARAYAAEFGVSMDTARANLAVQDDRGSELSALAALAGDRLVGSTLTQGRDVGAVISVSGTEPIPELEGAAVESGWLTVSHVDSAPRGELQEVVDRYADAWHERYPAVSGAYVDEQTGAIHVTVDGTAATTDLRAARLEDLAPAGVTVEVEYTGGATSDQLRGGLPLVVTSSGTATCTTGFSVRTSSGTTGVVTAAHCGNTLSYQSYSSSAVKSLTFRSESKNAHADVQWHSGPVSASPSFYASSTTSARTVVGLAYRADMVGSYACHRGRTTGYSCGTVQTVSYRPTYDGACGSSPCAATWARVTGSGLKCYGGDSGGPWFLSNRAYGIHKGGSSSGTGTGQCGSAWFTPIRYVDNYLPVTVHMGG